MPLIELKDATTKLFDYLIVGGGTAGLVLAARLTENPDTSVLVLEAGEENTNDPKILNSGQAPYLMNNKEYDWCMTTAPQSQCNNRKFYLPRGKVVGGSSAINFQVWSVPSKADIDSWELLGNEGWNWERFHKSIQRTMTYTPPTEEEYTRRGIPEQLRNQWKHCVGNGPLQISHPPVVPDIEIKVFQTFLNLGVPIAPAPIDGDPNGINIYAMTVNPKTLQRSYAANAYWVPNSERPNFHLLTGAIACRLISNNVNDELVISGVEFVHKSGGEHKYVAKALKEVILSTGTFKTPQILELSGIGRPDVLKKIGVPVKLPLDGVGMNVQEHISTFATFELKEGIPDETFDILRNPDDAIRHKELLTQSKGVYAMGIPNMIFAPLNTFSDKADEIIQNARNTIEAGIAAGKYSPAVADQYKILLDRFNKKVPYCVVAGYPGFFFGPSRPEPGKKYYTIHVGLHNPFSRGTIHVKSSNPEVDLDMNPHFFEQEIDLKILTEMVKFCKKVGRSAPFSDYLGETPVEVFPGPNITTDEEIASYLRAWVGTTNHPIGSASMLPMEKGGVVDNKLKVYGTKNLRVADLSIAPLHFGSHSQSVAYGIGEMAADIVKGDA